MPAPAMCSQHNMRQVGEGVEELARLLEEGGDLPPLSPDEVWLKGGGNAAAAGGLGVLYSMQTTLMQSTC